jgi:Leucine-rich repeat (LRR) protein
LNVGLNPIVYTIFGFHQGSKNNDKVDYLFIKAQSCQTFPKKIELFFPNLKVINVESSKLESISLSDIEPFSKLERLYITNNFISNLAVNLFAMNRLITYVNFDGNKIAKVGLNVLEPLKSLTEASFRANLCINQDSGSYLSITAFKTALNKNCIPELEMSK